MSWKPPSTNGCSIETLKRFAGPSVGIGGEELSKDFQDSIDHEFSKEEMNAYEASLKQKRDWNSSVAYAVEEALAKGEEKGRAEGREEGLEKGQKERRGENM
jgi:flagellar biosynthesis/type III secretory pathway protein FliH